jgi:hypothetical protein
LAIGSNAGLPESSRRADIGRLSERAIPVIAAIRGAGIWNTGSLGLQSERFDKRRPLGFFAINICGVFFRR